jgi:hypothetical protein
MENIPEMTTLKIHLIYAIILSICIWGILHLKDCQVKRLKQYSCISDPIFQIIRAQDRQILIAEAQFVDENESLSNTVYLNKLWEMDSLLQGTFDDLQTLPVAVLSGYRDSFDNRLTTLFKDDEEAKKIISNFPRMKVVGGVAEQVIRTAAPMQFRLRVSELYYLCIHKIMGDCRFGSRDIPFLLPVQKQVNQGDSIHLEVVLGAYKWGINTVEIDGSTKKSKDGVFTLDTIFQKSGLHPVCFRIKSGGTGRLPARFFYDTIHLQIFPN